MLLYTPSGGRFLSFKLARGSNRPFTEYKSKPVRNVHLSKINGIISLKQKKSSFTAKMFSVQSHIKQGQRNLFVLYGHSRTCFLTQQYVLVLRNVPTQLLIETLCCTPPIHRTQQLYPSFMHGCLLLN